jgi:predicted nucleic acid-binding protein
MQENEKPSPSRRSFTPISFCLDDADARREAARRNLPFIGTLGVLREAARRELVDLRVVLVQLQETSFFVDPALIESLLDEEARRKQRS